jgi:hypothetical protein
MKKITLDIDALAVDSFELGPGRPALGTVDANILPTDLNTRRACTCAPSCDGTCAVSCNGTCGATCDASCQGTCQTCAGQNTCNVSCGGTCDFSCDDSCVGPTCWDSCTCPF